MAVLSATGTSGAVEALIPTDRAQRMHNLEVDAAHTYFVGAGQWVVHNCDLSRVETELRRIATTHPSNSGRCVECATEMQLAISEHYPDLNLDIVRLQNKRNPFGDRPPIMRVRNRFGEFFDIAGRRGVTDWNAYHEVVRIQTEEGIYLMDALVYEVQGARGMPWDIYISRWEYPEDIEITDVR
ncbi:hypothetical protein HC928_11230 [bacterium]|nr:hypothetical protein [bacterium]